jgi:hypothetical protein
VPAALKRIDWNHPGEAARHIGLLCDRDAQLLRLPASPDATVVTTATADEHWDGRGKPAGVRATRSR